MLYTAEVFNAAIEKVVDLISSENNQKAGLIQEIAAGGVLFPSIISAIYRILLFIGKLF